MTVFVHYFYIEISEDYIYFYVQKPNKKSMFIKVPVFEFWYLMMDIGGLYLKIGYARVSTGYKS